ncbi:MAG TPA: FAD-dependent oxidoreductase [Gammaproteobacteria bacterium]|nr:FAD-dependent oxidoreductase [Gammaproteobacteria bacterium]
MKIAVIGSGISGLAAAWLLRKHADVRVYEKNAYAGGHTNTIQVPGGPAVDTGFIVFNECNYPEFAAMLGHLKVASQASDMSFAASIGGGRLEYAGDNLNTLFAQRWNLFDRSHWRMLLDITRFNRDAKRALGSGLGADLTLGEFILQGRYGDGLSRRYLLPMAAAIWSCPVGAMLQFPAASFLKFFENHGLLGLMDRPRWRTVSGGSREYVKQLLEGLGDRVQLNTAVTQVRRTPEGVRVRDASGNEALYDRVVMAAHGDESLAMLADVTAEERTLLGAFRYQENRALLHTDAALMPKRRSVWASWNYLAAETGEETKVSVTYWMNRLQGLPGDRDYFVTLNPLAEPAPESVIYDTLYMHPVFTREAMRAQEELPAIQGRSGIWFCGAWSGYGFHEDGLRSATRAVRTMGYPIPWEQVPGVEIDSAAIPVWGKPLAEQQ